MKSHFPKALLPAGYSAAAILALTIFTGLALPAGAAPLRMISVRNPAAGITGGGNGDSVAPVLSADGRFVVFASGANNLVPISNNQLCLNLYLYDRASNTMALVSANLNNNGGGNGSSVFGSASTNGRFVVFQSDASDLVAGDTNGATDVFVRDMVSGTTELISVSTNGSCGNGSSHDPVMTPDGRYVAFISSASNLVAGDTNNIPDVFVRDRILQTTVIADIGANSPSPQSARVTSPLITPDGRFVAYSSNARGLAAGVAANSPGEIYVTDLTGGTTIWASTNAPGIALATFGSNNIPSWQPALSDDGRYVAFKTGGTNGVGPALVLQFDTAMLTTTVVASNAVQAPPFNDDVFGPDMTPDGRYIVYSATNGVCTSVCLWDALAGTNVVVSVDVNGDLPTNTISRAATVTPDGRFVAFASNAGNLVTNVVTNGFHLYLRDLHAGTTMLLDGDANGVGAVDANLAVPCVSSNGQFAAFSTPDGNAVSGDTNGFLDVFVRDTAGGRTELISQRDPGVAPVSGTGASWLSARAVTPDGRYVAFTSAAGDLVTNDFNREDDVFVWDALAGRTSLVSVGLDGNAGSGGYSATPDISADGRIVAFVSSATNLVANDNNNAPDVFVRDLRAGTNALVSVSSDGVHSGNGSSTAPVLSQDGRYVAFLSSASNLASNAAGAFWRDLATSTTVLLPGSASNGLPPSMSANGRFVAYTVPSSYVNLWDLRVWDAQTLTYTSAVIHAAIDSMALSPFGTRLAYLTVPSTFSSSSTFGIIDLPTATSLYSVTLSGGIQSQAQWSSDGQYFVFGTLTSLNTAVDTNHAYDVYLRDLTLGTNILVSLNQDGTATANGGSDMPVITPDGRYVVYRSYASEIAPGVGAVQPNLILWDRLSGSNTVLTARNPISEWNPRLSSPAISSDAGLVAFQSWSGTLTPGDLNRVQDTFELIRVPLIVMNAPAISADGGTLQLDFGMTAGSSGTFTLLQADQLGSGWTTNFSAVLTTNIPGNSFRYSIPTGGPAEFYRIQAN